MNQIGINFHRIFRIFFLFQINLIALELNEFQTNSNLTPPLGKGSATSDFVVIHA